MKGGIEAQLENVKMAFINLYNPSLNFVHNILGTQKLEIPCKYIRVVLPKSI